MCIAFIAVLLHEMGHAVAARSFGARPFISLHFLGGDTAYSLPPRSSRWALPVIAAAGPLVGLTFGAFIYISRQDPLLRLGYPFENVYRDLLTANVSWALLNLLPVPPLDGGHIAEAFLSPRLAHRVAKVTALLALTVSLWRGYFSVSPFFAVLLLSAYYEFVPSHSPTSTPISGQRVPPRRRVEPEWAKEARKRSKEGRPGGA